MTRGAAFLDTFSAAKHVSNMVSRKLVDEESRKHLDALLFYLVQTSGVVGCTIRGNVLRRVMRQYGSSDVIRAMGGVL